MSTITEIQPPQCRGQSQAEIDCHVRRIRSGVSVYSPKDTFSPVVRITSFCLLPRGGLVT